MACNVNGATPAAGICDAAGTSPSPSPTLIPTLTPTLAAGEPFTVEMHSQPNDRSCTSEAIGGRHFGPVLIYMAKVDDATTTSPNGLSWFKVSEEGYDAAAKKWGTDSLNANCGKRTFEVPTKIPAGDYLVRAEAIALHTASQVGGAQFYMSCYVSFRPVFWCFQGGMTRLWARANMCYSKSRLRRAVVASCRLVSRFQACIAQRTPVLRLIFGGMGLLIILFRGRMWWIRLSFRELRGLQAGVLVYDIELAGVFLDSLALSFENEAYSSPAFYFHERRETVSEVEPELKAFSSEWKGFNSPPDFSICDSRSCYCLRIHLQILFNGQTTKPTQNLTERLLDCNGSIIERLLQSFSAQSHTPGASSQTSRNGRP